jgi:hypothetical protein
VLICNDGCCRPIKIIHGVDISGKILDKNGNPFMDPVEVVIKASTDYMDYSKTASQMQSTETKEYKILAQGGTFSWKGEGSSIYIKAEKDGYHSTSVDIFKPTPPKELSDEELIEQAMVITPETEMTIEKYEEMIRNQTIKRNDILIYLIPAGNPSKLQYTGSAEIPSKKREESGGKQCGWSFSKRWYYPVDGDELLDIIRGANEKKKLTYTMKEPGGFIYFEGYPIFESSSKGDYPYADFSLMPEAPESGYVPTFTPAEHKPTFRGNSYFCYFKTPDGKYGKICFRGDFDYYINPDGSRNLEAGEIVDKGPRNPIEAEWLDDELGGY